MDGSGGQGRARGRGRASSENVSQTKSTQRPAAAWGRQKPGDGAPKGPRPAAPVPVQGQGRATLHRIAPSTSAAAAPASATAVGPGGDAGEGAAGRSGATELGRGAMRGKRVIHEVVRTRPQNIQSKKGTTGSELIVQANYYRILKKPTWSLYQYRVDFSTQIEAARVRKYLMSQHKSVFGGYIFDGTMLFLSVKLDEDPKELVSKLDEEVVKITVKFVGMISTTESQSLQILNLILRRSMEGLKLQLVGRNLFDPVAKVDIREHRLQLWPGYTTSIRQHEQDILLCAEIVHKVMRTETLHDILLRCTQESRSYQDVFKKEVIGTTVLTDYNNKTYRIDDVDFNSNPLATFETKDGPVSFVKYYEKKYNIRIRDERQPVLISQSRERDIRAGQSEFIILIPELCRATGLNDTMRNNFQLMRAVADHTRLGPEARVDKLRLFNKRLASTEASMQVLTDWQMKIDHNLVEFAGRVLKNERIVLGNGRTTVTNEQADFTRDLRSNQMYLSIDLNNWFVIYPTRSQREANDFINCLCRAAKGMYMNMQQPKFVTLRDDKVHSYINAIENCCNNDPQIIMCVVPNNNAERYNSIKKKTCVDRAVPTQVVCHRTITPKGGNVNALMSVATKVVIQMNCKLGGAPWMVELPLGGLMTIGFDVCHSTRDKSKSYGALVATMDLKANAKYFSAVSPHKNGEELSNELSLNVTKALKEYRSLHNCLPNRILFYRDGVGEGQFHYVLEHETKLLKEKLKQVYQSANLPEPRFAFVIVSKRINTRFFTRGKNCPPGTVVDDVVTLPERYDFYLVSQSVRQGTVSPTSYNIIYDTLGLDPDKMQILTYKMTHLYYNWSGTTRVPAVCQYAHKLAFLVGQSIHQNPSNLLEKQLYFL